MIPGQATGTKATRTPSGAGPTGAASLGKGSSHSPGKSHRAHCSPLERPAWTHKLCPLTRLDVLETVAGVSGWAGSGFCLLFTRLALWHSWEDTGQQRPGW